MASGDNDVVAAKDEVPCFVECPVDGQGLALYMGVVLLGIVCIAVGGECQFPAGLATPRFIGRTGLIRSNSDLTSVMFRGIGKSFIARMNVSLGRMFVVVISNPANSTVSFAKWNFSGF